MQIWNESVTKKQCSISVSVTLKLNVIFKNEENKKIVSLKTEFKTITYFKMPKRENQPQIHVTDYDFTIKSAVAGGQFISC